jgi:hypothetical protein
LENFDPIGGWRDRYPRPGNEDPPVDASGKLADAVFRDVVSFKDVLLSRQREAFTRCLTEKLLVYALGRTLEPSDARGVDQIVATLQQRRGGLRDLVLLITESEAFGRK